MAPYSLEKFDCGGGIYGVCFLHGVPRPRLQTVFGGMSTKCKRCMVIDTPLMPANDLLEECMYFIEQLDRTQRGPTPKSSPMKILQWKNENAFSCILIRLQHNSTHRPLVNNFRTEPAIRGLYLVGW